MGQPPPGNSRSSAAWPVVTAGGHVSPQGTLIMARWLNAVELEHLGWTKSLQFDVFAVGSIRADDPSYSALPHLSDPSSVFVLPTSQSWYTLPAGSAGRPVVTTASS